MVVRVHCKTSKHKKWTGAKNSKIKLSQLGLMLFFPTQNEKKNVPTGHVYLKQQTRMTANQHIFKSGVIMYIQKGM